MNNLFKFSEVEELRAKLVIMRTTGCDEFSAEQVIEYMIKLTNLKLTESGVSLSISWVPEHPWVAIGSNEGKK